MEDILRPLELSLEFTFDPPNNVGNLMNELTMILLAVVAAFFLLNQLIILSHIRTLQGLLKQFKANLHGENRSNPTQNVPDQRPSSTARRIKFRAQTKIPGKVLLRDKFHSVIVEDLSQTGAMIRTEGDITLKVNFEYPFSTHLPSGESIQATLKIIRIVSAEEHSYGACFVNLPLKEKKILTKYVNDSANQELNKDIMSLS